MDPVEITAGRLHLRPWQPSDAPAVFDACQDPDIQRWTTVPSPYTTEDARGYVEQLSPSGWESGTTAAFAVLDATTGDLLASVALMGIADGSAELGYWCVAAARRRGVVSEAASAVCRWGFAELGLQRIEWQAEVGNEASRGVADRCGFVQEGVRRLGLVQRGERRDSWVASLLATDPGTLG